MKQFLWRLCIVLLIGSSACGKNGGSSEDAEYGDSNSHQPAAESVHPMEEAYPNPHAPGCEENGRDENSDDARSGTEALTIKAIISAIQGICAIR